MFITTDKDCYCPGDKISGHIYYHNFAPSDSKKVMLKLEGKETIPDNVFDKMQENCNKDVVKSYRDNMQRSRARSSIKISGTAQLISYKEKINLHIE